MNRQAITTLGLFTGKGLVTNYGGRGGYKTGRGGGGHMKFYPYEKGGGRRKQF